MFFHSFFCGILPQFLIDIYSQKCYNVGWIIRHVTSAAEKASPRHDGNLKETRDQKTF